MKIGIVDVDTSHPQNWIPIERNLDHVEVRLDGLSEQDDGYDGHAFGVSYRKSRYPDGH